jgi:hypothetical protein
MKKTLNCLLCAAFSLVMVSCNHAGAQVNRDDELKEIARTIDACIGWFKNKDFDLLT